MAQERVTITGDIIDDVKSEGDPSETVRENMLVGRIESTSELVEESCIVDGRFKEVIREKGSLMSQTWTDLFSLMNQYEAELVNKSGEIDIREAKLKSEESRLNLSALKSSQPSPVIAVLQQDNVEKDEKIMTYMGEINSLEKELAELRKELQLKDFHIQTIEKELANKDADIGGHEQRIKVLDQRILDLSAEIKNKDFVISQVSKQVRSMSMPGGKSRSRELRKRPLPIQVTSGPPKVLRTGDDATSAISLRTSPRQTSVASSSQKNDNAQSSPEDSNEDDPKDTDYIFEGGAESVYDDFDNPEPEPSTSDNQVKVKTEPTEKRRTRSSERSQMYQCTCCSKATCFVSRTLLDEHTKKFHRQSETVKKGNLECSVCGQKFKIAWDLKVHTYCHTGDYPFKCEVCGRGFARKTRFEEHVLTHKQVRPHRCDHCDKSFTSKYSLKDHLKTHTDSDHAYCKICDKSFSNSSGILYHMKAHKNDKKFVCEFCGKSYVNKQELLTHLMGHTGERPFKCPGCESGFRRQACVNRHVSAQKVEKNLTCGECNETFDLRCAAKKHTEEKHPKSEQIINKATGKLNREKTLTPMEDWPIKLCPGCSVGFLNDFGLDRHVESQKVLGNIACGDCNEIFELNCAFKKHTCVAEEHQSETGDITAAAAAVVQLEMQDESGLKIDLTDDVNGLVEEGGVVLEGEITTVPHALFETSSEVFLVLK